jgi:cobyrinic acid a,c-diamide synthase
MLILPRVVIAAPGSGHGKTTAATGLLAALTARGLRASGFKVGPDYIDASYLALATGRPARNLDPFLAGEDLIAPLFRHGAAAADVSIVEGVLGLYDGRAGAGDFGSTAHVATLVDAPVVVVVDASGQGRSVAALLHGFRTFGSIRSFGSVHIAGVILNRVGSDRHEAILRDACEEVGTPVLGVLPRSEAAAVASRHLGLIPAAEQATAAAETVAAMGALVAGGVDLDALMAVARSAPPLTTQAWAPPVIERSARPLVAVASGPAFTFGYREQLELIESAGGDIAPFDPLHDESLPGGTKAVVIGGGFPEVHAEVLSANAPLRTQIRELASGGAPIAAECAGLLWLGSTLDSYEMCGVLDVQAWMTPRLTLGYREAVAVSRSFLAEPGFRVHGHEFHRTTVEPSAGADPAWAWRGRPAEGFVQGNVHASYLHTHWAGYPDFARRLVEAACG